MKSVPLRGLQAFEAVGRCGSVTGAALELGVSPGAISQQVRKTEEHLGIALIERKGRKVELTSLGRLYHAEISKGFAQFTRANTLLQRARSDNVLVLSALSSVVNKWIGRKIFDWQALHPDAPIRIIGHDNEPRIGFDDIDFRITYGAAIQQHAHYSELYRDWVVPACSPALIGDRTIAAADIFGFPLLDIQWEGHFAPFPRWSDLAEKLNVPFHDPSPGLSFTLSSSAIDAAVNKRGFVLAQASMIADELEAGTLVVPIDVRLPLSESYYLAWDRSVLQKPFGQTFRLWITGIGRLQEKDSLPVAAGSF